MVFSRITRMMQAGRRIITVLARDARRIFFRRALRPGIMTFERLFRGHVPKDTQFTNQIQVYQIGLGTLYQQIDFHRRESVARDTVIDALLKLPRWRVVRGRNTGGTHPLFPHYPLYQWDYETAKFRICVPVVCLLELRDYKLARFRKARRAWLEIQVTARI